MSKKKCSAEVSIDTSCPPPTFEDYHRFTMLDPRTNYKGYVVRNWFPASTMNFVVEKLGQVEDLMDKYEIKNVEELDNRIKALEIIKEKRVNVRAFLKCCHREDGLTIYNNECDDKQEKESKELTQEEYKFLKEILNGN